MVGNIAVPQIGKIRHDGVELQVDAGGIKQAAHGSVPQ